MPNSEVIWSISEVNAAVRELLENSLMPFWLRGEVGTLNIYSSGHVYLTLKDKDCQLKCTFFRGAAQARAMQLAVGSEIEAFGKLSVYVQRGEYQFNIKNIRIAGAGSLQQQFEEIKNRLASEGLFAPENKLPLPFFPSSIGVITSPDGAAIRDFINVAKRRAPWLTIRIYPAAVQGAGCAESVIKGIDFFNRSSNRPDLLVITRGGGSMEDLWGFNSEALARAVAASTVPTISAIGHEIDFTICDFAASLRAPTPSAAAEIAVPDITEISADLSNKYSRIQRAWEFQYLKLHSKLKNLAANRIFHEPEYLLQSQSQKLDELSGQLERCWQSYLLQQQNRLQLAQAKLAALDPSGVLKRGFAILQKRNGTVADSCSKLVHGEKIQALMSDGTADLTVD